AKDDLCHRKESRELQKMSDRAAAPHGAAALLGAAQSLRKRLYRRVQLHSKMLARSSAERKLMFSMAGFRSSRSRPSAGSNALPVPGFSVANSTRSAPTFLIRNSIASWS